MNLLLHICCAPCAIKPVEALREKGHEVIGFWYNPNIHPYNEWKKRREAVEQLARNIGLSVIYDDHYDLEENLHALIKNPEFRVRCLVCYHDRISKTARVATSNGFEAFTTTLLYSKYQMHDDIRQICEYSTQYEWVNFYYEDFRLLWDQGIAASKKMGLYRQKWCGCIFSEYEAEKR
jgi:predicted adenine nucleotide alpha hydrolase (AANH) superfamily ATPase